MKYLKHFFLLLLFTSCEKDYNFKPQEEPNLLVVNAVLSNETGISVHVSKPNFGREKVTKESLFVLKAKVNIIDEPANKTYLLNYQSKGFYKDSLLKPIPTHVYRIEVEAADFPMAISESVQMPKVMDIQDTVLVQRDDLGLASGTGTKGKLLTFSFDDEKGEDYYNFYSKIADNAAFDWAGGGIYNVLSSCEQVKEGFIKDICFDGVRTTLSYKLTYQQSGLVGVYFERISKSYYLYEQGRRDTGGVISFFEEPVIQYSNIKNGYGVFIAKNTQKMLVKL